MNGRSESKNRYGRSESESQAHGKRDPGDGDGTEGCTRSRQEQDRASNFWSQATAHLTG